MFGNRRIIGIWFCIRQPSPDVYSVVDETFSANFFLSSGLPSDILPHGLPETVARRRRSAEANLAGWPTSQAI
jgi:hypothetical protein